MKKVQEPESLLSDNMQKMHLYPINQNNAAMINIL